MTAIGCNQEAGDNAALLLPGFTWVQFCGTNLKQGVSWINYLCVRGIFAVERTKKMGGSEALIYVFILQANLSQLIWRPPPFFFHSASALPGSVMLHYLREFGRSPKDETKTRFIIYGVTKSSPRSFSSLLRKNLCLSLTSSVIRVAIDRPISWYCGPLPRGPSRMKRNLCEWRKKIEVNLKFFPNNEWEGERQHGEQNNRGVWCTTWW